jgi:uncharacterized protein
MSDTDPEISDDDVLAAYPDVRLDHDNKHHYRGLLQRRYLVNRCTGCRTWHAPPRARCPQCWSTAIEPTPLGGEATVELVTFLHQGPPAPGVDYSEPYPLVSARFDGVDGIRVSGTVVNAAKGDIAIGLRVRHTWVERDGKPYPVFEPVSTAKGA